MTLWIVFAFMTGAALLALLWPLRAHGQLLLRNHWATMNHRFARVPQLSLGERHGPNEAASRVWEAMSAGFQNGLTCIDCHKGIAHKLPNG